MNLCPRVYGADMADPENLRYCRQIQHERRGECRWRGCPYADGAAEVGEDKGPEQDRPAPVQRGLF